MIKITIPTDKTATRKWTDKTTGELRQMTLQTALVYLTNPDGELDGTYDKLERILNTNEHPLPAGDYTLSPASFYLDRNGRLAVSLNNLKSLAPQK